MFDNWIGLGPLAEAYNLNADECIEVARHVPCKFGPSSGNRPYDLEKIGDLARATADKLERKAAQDAETGQSAISFMFGFAQSQWYKKGGIQYENYKYLSESGAEKEASYVLWVTVRLVHILDLAVNKSQAVLFLAKNGYPFKTEVKGLTKAVNDHILAANTTAHETPPASPVANPSQPTAGTVLLPPAATSPPTPKQSFHPGSRKDSTRINATRKACEEVREEIKRGKHCFEINDTRKTNHKTFLAAVSEKLASIKPHIVTVEAEWGKVDKSIKHNGRVPDQ